MEDNYLGSGILISKAIKKYGRKTFKKEILYILSSEKEMFDKELEIVNEDFVLDDNTYNLTLGGRGGNGYHNIGRIFSKEHKDKLKLAKKLNNFHKGRKLTEEHKLKLSKAKENYKPWNTGKTGVMEYTQDRNNKISEARKKNKGKMMFIYYEFENGDIKRTKIYKELFEEYFQQGWRYGAKRKIK